jgi:hypothetical protein
MTQDEIIEMARQAGFFVKDSEAYSPSVQEDHELTPYLETFAKLVAEKERERMTVVAMDAAEKAVDVAIKLEREACAKICDEFFKGDKNINYSDTIAICIRAREKA